MKIENEIMFAEMTNEEFNNLKNQIITPNDNEVFITSKNQALIKVKMLDETECCVPAFPTFKEAEDFFKGNNDVERIDIQLLDTKKFQYFYVPFPKQTEKKEVNEKTTNNNN